MTTEVLHVHAFKKQRDHTVNEKMHGVR